MQKIILLQLDAKVTELGKKHGVEKDRIQITYREGQLRYLVHHPTQGTMVYDLIF